MTEQTAPTANRQIARAAGTVMLAFVLSNLVGLMRQILVSKAFGTGVAIDAFNAASTYPDLIFNLVAGGALASAFIPTFTALLAQEKRPQAWHLASSIINLVLLLLTLLSVLSAIFAPHIVEHLLAPEFPPSQQALTVHLLRILLIAPAVFGLSGLMMGILNAHQVFWLPALAPTMYWLGMIFGVVALSPSMGIDGLAWGAVLGAFLHLGIQIPGLLRLPGRRYLPTLGLRSAHVREVGRLMAPRLLGVAVVQLNFVVNTLIASGQPEGSLTAIKVAWAVMTMPQVVIAQAIAIAALPTFSAQIARGQPQEMRASLAATLRGVLLLALPSAAGLIVLRQPVIRILFQRGAFDAHSTRLVAWALLWYTLGLVSHSVVEILARAFYALHDTKTPVFVGAAAMSLNVAFSFGFAALFERLGWMPHGGLALANTLATTLEMGGLLYLMRRRLRGLDGRLVGTGLLQAGAATLGMLLALGGWLFLARDCSPWVTGGVGILLGGGVYAAAALALRLPEAHMLLAALRRWLAPLFG